MHQNLSKELVDFSKIKSPVITILILYDGNSEKLDLTMDSVQKQHYKNWNVILLPINSQSF